MPAMLHLPIEPVALDAALSAWKAEHPEMGVLALVPEAETGGVAALQAACRAQAVPLVGGVFPALVTSAGFATDGAWLLRFDRMPTAVLVDALSADSPTAARQIAARLTPHLRDDAAPPNLFLILDAMLPNAATILENLYLELSDRVSYAGVSAGSETFQPVPCLFDGARLIGGGALCLLLEDRPYPVLEHGYSPPSRALAATATVGNRIRTIDWRPAFEVYRELVQADFGVALTPENFYSYGVHFPFGILQATGELVVRIPVGLAEDGSVFCVGEVPTNSLLVLLEGPQIDTSRCVSDLARRLGESQDVRGGGLLTFYCAGRRLHMGDTARQEVVSLHAQTGAAVTAGALTLGELGARQEWSYPCFHNATLVCARWG